MFDFDALEEAPPSVSSLESLVNPALGLESRKLEGKRDAAAAAATDCLCENRDSAFVHCSRCGHRVARRQHNEGSSSHVNPNGVHFHIGRFSAVDGVKALGDATSEGTWFPGWDWRAGECQACRAHLGWRFECKSQVPFWGLIWGQLIENPKLLSKAVGKQADADLKNRPVDRARLACASIGCNLLVHSRPQLGGYCCIACSESGGHGHRCEGVVAPKGTPKADVAWLPMAGKDLMEHECFWNVSKKFADTAVTHQDLRRNDARWQPLSERAKAMYHKQLCGQDELFDESTYIDYKKHKVRDYAQRFVGQQAAWGWSLDWSPSFFCELAYEGFIPASTEIQSDDAKVQVLLPWWDRQRSILDFRNLHVSRQVRKRAKTHRLTVDAAFDDVMLGIVQQHSEDWFFRAERWVLRSLFHGEGARLTSADRAVTIHSFELWDSEGKLVAGDLGYTVGAIYTSMTGFRKQHSKGAGEVQLVLTALFLKKLGYAWMDLGMNMKYKQHLGAHIVGRVEFAKLLRQWRDKHLIIAHESISGTELLQVLVQEVATESPTSRDGRS